MKEIRIRVAVILIKNGKILLVQHKKDGRKYWVVPGGGLNFGESVSVCARRELREELNLKILLGRLVFAVESIAKDSSRHILNLFFTGKIVGGRLRVAKDHRLNGSKFIDINKLDKIKLYPLVGRHIKEAYRNNFKNQIMLLSPEWI